MKKTLKTASITNELAGASAYFTRPTPPPDAKPDVAFHRPNPDQSKLPAAAPQVGDTQSPETALQVFPERQPRRPVSMKASTLARYPASTVETIRKAVKQTGREVTFVRLTPEEKAQLADIVYTYKRQGVKTSENEISRIALSNLLADYHANGQASILAQVIAALLA